MIYRKILTILFLFSTLYIYPYLSVAQTDTVFWFAVPNAGYGPGNDLDHPIRLQICANSSPAQVTVQQIAGGGMPTQTFTVGSNSVYSLNLTNWLNVLETIPANQVLNYGLKISADVPIIVYYTNDAVQNPEAYALKGEKALGTNFWIPSQSDFYNNQAYPPGPYSSFDIIATEDNTLVTINPRKDIIGHPANVPFNITLNAGQVWSAAAIDGTTNQHLAGSHVQSNKNIAITVQDDLLTNNSYGVCADVAGDQIVPITNSGTKYVAVNGYLNNVGDLLYITASENNTTISQNGNTVATINSGQTHQLNLAQAGNQATYIQTSNPTVVWQLSGISCEVGATQLPHIECTGSNTISYIRMFDYELYFNVIVPSGGQNSFVVNGATNFLTSADFSPVPGTSNAWYYARKLMPLALFPLNNIITISNATHLFHLGVLDASTQGASYGYFSDYGFNSVVASYSNNCIGDDLQLNAVGAAGATFQWTGPNSFTSNLANPTINGITSANSGTYIVACTTDCGVDIDTLQITIHPLPDIDLGVDTVICSGNTYTLNASGDYDFLWSTGSTGNHIEVSSSGVYTVTATVPNSTCSSTDTVEITVVDGGAIDLGNDTTICLGVTSFDLDVGSQPSGTSFVWSTGATTPYITITETGSYSVVATYLSGCQSTDSIYVNMQGVASVSAMPDYLDVCEGLSEQLEASGAVSYIWSPSDYLSNPSVSNPIVTPLNSIEYLVTGIDQYGCVGVDTVTINLLPSPDIAIETAYTYIDCSSLPVISVTATGADSYLWYPGDFVLDSTSSTTVIFPNSSMYMNVRGEQNGCYSYDSIYVEVRGQGKIVIPNAFSPNGDNMNDLFKIDYACNFTLETFVIYNRWGEMVFSTNDINQGWDGIYKGSIADLGVYMYAIKGKSILSNETQFFKGDVVLLR